MTAGPPHARHEGVDLLFAIVDIEARARRPRETEFAHQRLVAVVATAQRDAVLVRKCDDIVRVEFNCHPFRLHSLEGKTVETLSVIVATGARANYLGLPSEDRFKNNGVSACAVCDGALPRFRNKPLVVVGGGDSAVEEATYLTKYASTVYMLMRRDVFRASKIMQERAQSNPKIEIQYFREVDEVLGDDKAGVTGIRMKNNKEGGTADIEASGLFLAIGHTPNLIGAVIYRGKTIRDGGPRTDVTTRR